VTVVLATLEEVLKVMTPILKNPSFLTIKVIINTMTPHQIPRRPPDKLRLRIVINVDRHRVIVWASKTEKAMLELIVLLVTVQIIAQDGKSDLR
jgi:hypothetical protein